MGKRPVIADIRANIQAEMKRLGLKSKPLSKDAGLSESAIRDLMRKVDDPRVGTLLALSEAMGISLGLLLGEMVPLVGVIGPDTKVKGLADDELEFVPRPPSREHEVEAYRVEGAGLWPAYRAGDLLYASACKDHAKIACCNGRECIVRIGGGDTYLRTVLTVGNGTSVLLQGYGQPPIQTTEIECVSPILFISRANNVDIVPQVPQVNGSHHF